MIRKRKFRYSGAVSPSKRRLTSCLGNRTDLVYWESKKIKSVMVTDFIFLDSKIIAYGDCSHKIKRRLLLGRKAITNLNSILQSRDITLLTKVCIVKAMVFSVVRYRLSAEELMLLNCFAREDSLDSNEIKQSLKGNQPRIFITRTDRAETEALILWPLNMKSQFIGKDHDAEKV